MTPRTPMDGSRADESTTVPYAIVDAREVPCLRRVEKQNWHLSHPAARINHQRIFDDDEDCSVFLETLVKYREECGYSCMAIA